MTSLARIRPSLRRAAFVAALGALMVPATAGASVHATASAKKKKAKAPVVTRVSPMKLAIGQTLDIHGRYFLRGRNRNTVVFKRTGGKAVFVKAIIGTTKLLRVTVPAKLGPELSKSAGNPVATRFRIRVLAKKFGKRYTSAAHSPLVSPAPAPGTTGPGSSPPPTLSVTEPDGDCDGDHIKNSVDTDDDNDLLPDDKEAELGTDPCKADTDGDGVEDGFEYRSAIDLNNDEYQDPNVSMPYPGKRPYPNPLDSTDATTDYDGDGLTLGEEYKLWVYSYSRPGKIRSLDSLYYSDGMQYSIYKFVDGDRRKPALSVNGYEKTIEFQNWLNPPGPATSGYETVYLHDVRPVPDPDPDAPDTYSRFSIFDSNRDGTVSPTRVAPYRTSERNYLDTDNDGWLSDDERDEDADGLSNFVEAHGPLMSRGWWTGVYPLEGPFTPVEYAGTQLDNWDSDGDGVPDGADDQDHDDIPNLMEVSRSMASGRAIGSAATPDPVFGRVNPFNPCEPDINSRTCPRYIPIGGGAWAPFDGPPYDSTGTDPNYGVNN
jgi:hypothetical protein